jgi:hypothetical protein
VDFVPIVVSTSAEISAAMLKKIMGRGAAGISVRSIERGLAEVSCLTSA